jgi:hypothetical protein
MYEGFGKKPKFLTEDELLSFKRDTCIFCNLKFKGEDVEYSRIYRSRGDHYGGDREEEYFDVIYELGEEIYYFDFEFDKDFGREFQSAKEAFLKKREKKIQEEAEKLREELNNKINLQGERKETAINAIVNDYLSQLKRPRSYSYSHELSPLEIKVSDIFHNLKFGDLTLACKKESYHAEPKDYKHVHLEEHVLGLKSHPNCWPFEAPLNGVQNPDMKVDIKDYSFEFQTYVKNFLDVLRKNPIFKGYSKQFESNEDLQKLWNSILDLDITIKARNYRP